MTSLLLECFVCVGLCGAGPAEYHRTDLVDVLEVGSEGEALIDFRLTRGGGYLSATGRSADKVRIWDLGTKKSVADFVASSKNYSGTKYVSDDGNAVWEWGPKSIVWRKCGGAWKRVFENGPIDVNAVVRISPNGRVLLQQYYSAGEGMKLTLTRLGCEDREVSTLDLHPWLHDQVVLPHFSDEGKTVTYLAIDRSNEDKGSLVRIKSDTGEEIEREELVGRMSVAQIFGFHARGATAVVAFGYPEKDLLVELHVYDLKRSRLSVVRLDERSRAWYQLSPNGNYLAVLPYDAARKTRTPTIYSTETCEPIAVLQDGEATDLQFSGDEKSLVLAYPEGRVRRWDFKSK